MSIFFMIRLYRTIKLYVQVIHGFQETPACRIAPTAHYTVEW